MCACFWHPLCVSQTLMSVAQSWLAAPPTRTVTTQMDRMNAEVCPFVNLWCLYLWRQLSNNTKYESFLFYFNPSWKKIAFNFSLFLVTMKKNPIKYKNMNLISCRLFYTFLQLSVYSKQCKNIDYVFFVSRLWSGMCGLYGQWSRPL